MQHDRMKRAIVTLLVLLGWRAVHAQQFYVFGEGVGCGG